MFKSFYKIRKQKSLYKKGIGETPCKREGKREEGEREPKGREDPGTGGQQRRQRPWVTLCKDINHLPQTAVWNYLNHIHVHEKKKIFRLSEFFVKGLQVLFRLKPSWCMLECTSGEV